MCANLSSEKLKALFDEQVDELLAAIKAGKIGEPQRRTTIEPVTEPANEPVKEPAAPAVAPAPEREPEKVPA